MKGLFRYDTSDRWYKGNTHGGEEITEATMPVPADWDYAYIEIEDRQGRRAWTNTLFVQDHPTDASVREMSIWRNAIALIHDISGAL